jgi:hypothetical protein
VISINVGTKRVHLTAYCPDDALGLLACDFVLDKAREALDNTAMEELRKWIAEQPGGAEFLERLDTGWQLRKNDPFTVDPNNVTPEVRIIAHLRHEMQEQRS